ncbi:radical SAM protein [Candidatus Woesearchaeota archaeon]|nr:radical SAM protein [Candidatus Woesearchaeota archaeon]
MKQTKDVVLINAPSQFYSVDSMGNEMQTDKTYSVGLAYVSSSVKRAGFDAGFIDGNFYRIPVDDIVEQVAEQRPEAVGMNVTLPNLSVVLETARKIKDSYDPLIIIGGPGATLLHDKIISHDSIDVVVRNEGEITVPKVLSGAELEYIPGITYKKNSVAVVNSRSEPITDLDSLAFPDTSIIPDELKETGIVSMFTTRGCSNQCTYCSTPQIWDRKIKFRSPESMIEEIDNYRRDFELKEIHFLDDTFTVSRKRLNAFLDAYVASGMHKDVKWRCLSRINTVDEETLIRMKDAGCYHISYGIESANEDVLKRIRKNITPEKAKDVCEMTSSIGIKTKAFFMIGFPWETEKEIKETLDYAAALDVDRVGINIVKAYPGTVLYEEVNRMFPYTSGFSSGIDYKGPEKIQQCLNKYAAIPERSCNPYFSTQELLGFAEQGFQRFMENRGEIQ